MKTFLLTISLFSIHLCFGQEFEKYPFQDTLQHASHVSYLTFLEDTVLTSDDMTGILFKVVEPEFKREKRWVLISEYKKEKDTFFHVLTRDKHFYFEIDTFFKDKKAKKNFAYNKGFHKRWKRSDSQWFYTGDFANDTCFYFYDSLVSDGYVAYKMVKSEEVNLQKNELFYPKVDPKFKLQDHSPRCTMRSNLVLKVQMKLKLLGYETALDNVFTEQNRDALIAYQKKHGLPAGNLNVETLKHLGIEGY